MKLMINRKAQALGDVQDVVLAACCFQPFYFHLF